MSPLSLELCPALGGDSVAFIYQVRAFAMFLLLTVGQKNEVDCGGL
jgi:hypothetical protein